MNEVGTELTPIEELEAAIGNFDYHSNLALKHRGLVEEILNRHFYKAWEEGYLAPLEAGRMLLKLYKFLEEEQNGTTTNRCS